MQTLNQWKYNSPYTSNLLNTVRWVTRKLIPNTEIILYGSRVRNEARKDSDWDFLILVDQPIDRKSISKIKDSLYDIELENNEILSSIIRTKQEWNSPEYYALPFRKIIENEGVML